MTTAKKLKGLFILPPQYFDLIYGPEQRKAICELVDIPDYTTDPSRLDQIAAQLREVEVIFSGWGSPILDEAFLNSVPRLQAYFFGGGGIKGILTEAFWKRNIPLCSAWGANAVPVSEFAFAQIILSLKRAWHFIRHVREERRYGLPRLAPGAFHSTVGLVSMGMSGRFVREKLRMLDVHVLAYDPYLSAEDAATLAVETCSLEELFRRSDVVSLHAPSLPATERMITGRLLASMKPDATFINTARGILVEETQMIEVLQSRPDLFAILDVTWPEPPARDSPLFTLPNVVLSPHIAGSMDAECRRMGQWMMEEARRFIANEPLLWQVTPEKGVLMA